MKKHYYSVMIVLLALFVLGWKGYASAVNFKTVNQPLAEKIIEHVDQEDGKADDFSYDLKKIFNSGFFTTSVKLSNRTVEAKQTSLKLVLEGTIAAQNSDISRAVIRSNQKKPILYKIGDEIEGTNAELNAVEHSRVLIEREGVLESLVLKREKLNTVYIKNSLKKEE